MLHQAWFLHPFFLHERICQRSMARIKQAKQNPAEGGSQGGTGKPDTSDAGRVGSFTKGEMFAKQAEATPTVLASAAATSISTTSVMTHEPSLRDSGTPTVRDQADVVARIVLTFV